jgi:hypothetical protein
VREAHFSGEKTRSGGGRFEGKESDFRGRKESERHACVAEATIDIEANIPDGVPAGAKVFRAYLSEFPGGNEGQNDLSAVGVAGQRETSPLREAFRSAGVVDQGEGGFVRRNGGESRGDIGFAFDVVVYSRDPEAARQLDAGVVEHGDADVLQGAVHGGAVCGVVVVAENGVDAERGFQLREDVGARGDVGGVEIDVVAGQDDEVGTGGVGARDGFAEEAVARQMAAMKVGEMSDTQAIKGVCQVGKGDGMFGAFNFHGVEGVLF